GCRSGSARDRLLRAHDRMRTPAVAGTFYPSDPSSLRAEVERLLEGAGASSPSAPPAAVIVPHAGYAYSGPIAASAYALLRTGRAAIERVVLIGPAHFVPLSGAAAPAATAWHTPLGVTAVDPALVRRARSLGASVDDAPHAPEHALGVQLPFLQVLLGPGVPLLPLAVGDADRTWVADLLEALVGPGTLLVVSTDL